MSTIETTTTGNERVDGRCVSLVLPPSDSHLEWAKKHTPGYHFRRVEYSTTRYPEKRESFVKHLDTATDDEIRELLGGSPSLRGDTFTHFKVLGAYP